MTLENFNIDDIKESSFLKNNIIRKEKGLEPYSLEEYLNQYINGQKETIKMAEDGILRTEERIEKIKNRLKNQGEEVEKLKQILSSNIQSGIDNVKIKEITSLIEGYEKQFGVDNLLDELNKSLKDIETYKQWIEDSKSIINSL